MNIFISITLILILYLLAIMPRIRNKPDMSTLMGVHYAHRGLHNAKKIAPENSLTAFKLAVENNYGIELDVQLSSDNIPVVFHDFTLNRVCGVDKSVSDLTFDELRLLRLYDSEEFIPLFKEVLDLVNGQVPLIIEYKIKATDTLVCEIGDNLLKDYKGIYCIESFNPLALWWYKKNRPDVVRGQLSTKFSKKKGSPPAKVLNFTLQNLMFNFLSKPDFVAFDYRYSKMLSFSLSRRLFKTTTVAYTLKNNQSMADSMKAFDLFIFEGFTPEEKK